MDEKNPRVAKTYTIRLCENGEEFDQRHNVAEKPNGGRFGQGDVIDEWKIIGVRSNTPSELVVDVEKVPKGADFIKPDPASH